MATFKDAVGRGAFVTVMDAKVYKPDAATVEGWSEESPSEIVAALLATTAEATIDHLKFANLTMSGPDITITGGRYANTLVKFGKSLRLEMQSALCSSEALEALGGVTFNEADESLTITDEFSGPVTIVGDTIVVDQASGEQIPVKIIVYRFLPDSIVSLTQDEATAATFDMNGDVMTVQIQIESAVSTSGGCSKKASAFYSIVDGCPEIEPAE